MTLSIKFLSIVSLFLIAALFPLGQGAEATNEEPVMLPEYRVTAPRLPSFNQEYWHYAAWDDFEIISSADEETTSAFVKELQYRLAALAKIMPPLKTGIGFPFQIIIHGPGITRKQLYKGDLYSGSPASEAANYVMRLQKNGRTTLVLRGDDFQSASQRMTPKMHPTICAAQYIRSRMLQFFPPPPKWYEISLTILAQGASASDKRIRIGRLNNLAWRHTTHDDVSISRAGLEEPDEEYAKRMRRLLGYFRQRPDYPLGLPKGLRVNIIPLERMFSWTPISMEFWRKNRVPPRSHRPRWLPQPYGLWEEQCLVFMHYCVIRSDDGPLRNGYLQLVRRAAQGPISEDVFRECMGMGFKEMEKQLENYVNDDTAKNGYDTWVFNFKEDLKIESVPLRKATQSEVARIKGEALAFQGKLKLARETMLVPYDRKKADPPLCSALGILEFEAGDVKKARALLTVAMQNKEPNPEIYRTLARIEFQDALKGKKPTEKIAPDASAPIYELLQIARELRPYSASTYMLYCELFFREDLPLNQKQLGIISEGCRQFPDDVDLTFEASKLLVACGQKERAMPLIKRGLAQIEQPKDNINWFKEALRNIAE